MIDKKNDLLIIKEATIRYKDSELEPGKEYFQINPEKINEAADKVSELLYKKNKTNEEIIELTMLCLVLYNQTPEQLKETITFIKKRLPKDTTDLTFDLEVNNILENKVVTISKKK